MVLFCSLTLNKIKLISNSKKNEISNGIALQLEVKSVKNENWL